jgi:LmbE family N-acetylglucosaminyl deacetylase
MSISRSRFLRLFLPLFVLGPQCLVFAVPARGETGLSGSAQIEQALHRLNALGSVLMIAAHPDDENTALLAYYARGRLMRTGYLSLTRGEGGQNLIGPEQGDLLGVIRTQELLAARRIDGAEQFFTRAIDFGYTKSADETLAKWGREKVLSDIVWVIRKFRPDIVILRFSGTPRDGHGQHQSSAILGQEAFFAAADPARFPEQFRYVKPWQAHRLLFNVFSFSPRQEKEARELPNRIEVDTGEFNPILGKSYTEIAGISRSMHRSQGMGAPERRGPSKNYLVTIAGPVAEHEAFDGIDATWSRVRGGDSIGKILSDAVHTFRSEQPEKTIPLLLKARPLIAAIDDPWAKLKLAELDEVLGLLSGLWLDATTERYAAVRGSVVTIQMEAINRSQFPITWSGSLVFQNENAGFEIGAGVMRDPIELAYNEPHHEESAWKVPQNQLYSQPYWLRKPHTADIYEIDQPEWIGLPDTPPLLTARFELNFSGTSVTLDRPVHYRYVDPTGGELTRGLVIVPAVAVNLPEGVVLFPSEAPKKIEVELKANAANAAGDLHLDLPQGWHVEPSSQSFHLGDEGSEQALTFSVTPPRAQSEAHVRAIATMKDGDISSGMTVIAFPHIPTQVLFPDAAAKLERTDVKLTAHKVAYVMGAGDQVPEALRQLGCDVTLLSARDLAEHDLGAFDAIVTGVRAYNVRSDLRANQQRLLDYVHGGGTLIVQYNVAEGGPFGGRRSGELAHIGPFPLEIGRDRVTVEESPVKFIEPDHALLTYPNHITEHDFDNWVQERGLYFASKWDAQYQPVLEANDPGEKPLEGGMLYARYGKGVYIFSAYSWFRELPAGVPGAYRIFANMLSSRGQR